MITLAITYTNGFVNVYTKVDDEFGRAWITGAAIMADIHGWPFTITYA